MNRYSRGPTIGGPSKATPSTTCQKCLKKDEYCRSSTVRHKADLTTPLLLRVQSGRARKALVPKLTSDVPQELLRKKGVADEQLAKAELERGRKRDRRSEEPELTGTSKRRRSVSMSSASVSTISTNMSRSPSPQRSYARADDRRPTLSRSPSSGAPNGQNRRYSSISRSPSPRPRVNDGEKKRRRDSFSSAESYSSSNRKENEVPARKRDSSRSTRRKYQHMSPPARGRTTESRSPQSRGRRAPSRDRSRDGRSGAPSKRNNYMNDRPAPRERSLSPFSKRLALTQSMNMGS